MLTHWHRHTETMNRAITNVISSSSEFPAMTNCNCECVHLSLISRPIKQITVISFSLLSHLLKSILMGTFLDWGQYHRVHHLDTGDCVYCICFICFCSPFQVTHLFLCDVRNLSPQPPLDIFIWQGSPALMKYSIQSCEHAETMWCCVFLPLFFCILSNVAGLCISGTPSPYIGTEGKHCFNCVIFNSPAILKHYECSVSCSNNSATSTIYYYTHTTFYLFEPLLQQLSFVLWIRMSSLFQTLIIPPH